MLCPEAVTLNGFYLEIATGIKVFYQLASEEKDLILCWLQRRCTVECPATSLLSGKTFLHFEFCPFGKRSFLMLEQRLRNQATGNPTFDQLSTTRGLPRAQWYTFRSGIQELCPAANCDEVLETLNNPASSEELDIMAVVIPTKTAYVSDPESYPHSMRR